MLRKAMIVLAAAATLGTTFLPADASAAWRRHGWHGGWGWHHAWGWRWRGPRWGYYGYPYRYPYYSPYYPGYGGDDAYCASRYRSYDPVTGTYLGYDGLRHPCP